MGKLGSGVATAGLCLLIAAGCGDDDAPVAAGSGEGCLTDIECKGDRICVDGECVDPEDAPDGGGGRAGASGSRAGRGGGGGASAGAGAGAGDGGASGSRGGSGGSGPIDDPELERACGLNCEARHEAACEMNIGSL